MKKELHSGFISSAVQKYFSDQSNFSYWKNILRDLSTFTLEIDNLKTDKDDSLFVVIDNLLSRGLPTIPTILIEDALEKSLQKTKKRIPDKTGNIPITNGYIFDMLPVDSFIRTGSVTGEQLKTWLEKELNNVFAQDASKRFGGWVIKFKGMEVSFKAFAEMGNRIQEMKIGGKPVDLNKMYTVSACERDGDPDDMLCRIRGVKNAKNTTHTLHKAMTNYLAANSPVTPTPPKAAKALDAPETLLTQVYGVDYQFI